MSEDIKTKELIDRYNGYSHYNSVKFRAVVDLLVYQMEEHKIPPDEIRDAAFLASIIFIQRHPINLFSIQSTDPNEGEG